MERKLEGNHTLQTRGWRHVRTGAHEIAPIRYTMERFFPPKYISWIAWAPLKIHNLSNAGGQQRARSGKRLIVSGLHLFAINVNTQLCYRKSLVNIFYETVKKGTWLFKHAWNHFRNLGNLPLSHWLSRSFGQFLPFLRVDTFLKIEHFNVFLFGVDHLEN